MSQLFDLILADPPWDYANKASRGAANNHYDTTKYHSLAEIPVGSIAAPNSVLIMWYTGNFNQEAIDLAKAWGFTLKTMKGFTWVKLNKLARAHIEKAMRDQLVNGGGFNYEFFIKLLNEQTRMNGGNYTRANTEDCLIAIKGNGLERLDASIKQVVYAPLDEHSRKPEEVRQRIERLYGDVRRVELFSRTTAPGWAMWGNQAPECADVFAGVADNDNQLADQKTA